MPAKDVWETVLTPIVPEIRVGIDVVLAVFVVSALEVELVGSGKDKGGPTTQLGREVSNGTANDEVFRVEGV